MITPPRRRALLTALGGLLGVYVVVTLLLIGLGLLMTQVLLNGPVGHWDNDVVTWSVRHRTSGWNQLSADATALANTLGIVVVAAVATGVVLLVRRTRWALLFAAALVIELTGFLSANYTVGRPRPAVQHLGSTPTTFSWPSGHVAATCVLYGGIAILVTGWTRRIAPALAAWLLAAFLVVAVAASRVYRGEHHPTDVIAGLLLGVGALVGATQVLSRYRERQPGPDRLSP